jgi:hypothetical protein
MVPRNGPISTDAACASSTRARIDGATRSRAYDLSCRGKAHAVGHVALRQQEHALDFAKLFEQVLSDILAPKRPTSAWSVTAKPVAVWLSVRALLIRYRPDRTRRLPAPWHWHVGVWRCSTDVGGPPARGGVDAHSARRAVRPWSDDFERRISQCALAFESRA